MFAYYLNLALRSFGRNKALTTLMVLTIALGIGASMTTLTVFHVISGDPIPGKSDRLFTVQMNVLPDSQYEPDEADESLQMTRIDAQTLLKEARGKRQALMSAGGVVITPTTAGQSAFRVESRYTTADFFPMFEVPLRYGQPWSARDDDDHARVAVISSKLNEKLFGGADSTGRTLQVGGQGLRVVGVLDPWAVNPRFYDLTNSEFGDSENVFVPFSTALDLKLSLSGSMWCWGDTPEGRTALSAPCAFLQYWTELGSASDAADYRRYLDNYIARQHDLGRFRHPGEVQLRNVMQWLDHNHVVPADVRLQLWLALGFLLICLLNTIGLLLAKFLRRSSEIGVRRALGASRLTVFAQYLVESGIVGLSGGALGLVLALLGLAVVRRQPADYASLAHMDTTMLLSTFALALLSSLLAGALPAWRAMQVTPAIQLKSQ
jgi:putative ABC transport system permease protein